MYNTPDVSQEAHTHEYRADHSPSDRIEDVADVQLNGYRPTTRTACAFQLFESIAFLETEVVVGQLNSRNSKIFPTSLRRHSGRYGFPDLLKSFRLARF